MIQQPTVDQTALVLNDCNSWSAVSFVNEFHVPEEVVSQSEIQNSFRQLIPDNNPSMLNGAPSETSAEECGDPSASFTSKMLQMLTTSPLPKYKPPEFPKELLEGGPPETYPCTACGDTFALKSSLTYHLKRRSILIRFSCESCPSVQAFYNRCTLICHILAHRDRGELSDVSKVTVLPLPQVLMEGMQTGIIENLENEDDDEDSRPISPSGAETPPPLSLLEISMSEGENKIEIGAPSENLKTKLVKAILCSECSNEFSVAEDRKNHFTNKEFLPTVISPCTKCGIICPSECSTKAHKRLHLQISPYVCPECGDNPDRYWDNFQRHLTYQCFHYARSLSYKCSLCNKLYTSPQLLKQHSVSNHMDIIYKCQMCPMAFNSVTLFQVHKRKHHAEEMLTGGLTDSLQMYRCLICQDVFFSKEDTDTHWDGHLTKNICQYGFKCFECAEVLESKSNLTEHLKESHVEFYNKHIAVQSTSQVTSSSKASEKEIYLSKARVECILCHAAFGTRQGHSLHVTKSHTNHKYPCGVCSRISVNRLEMISHGKEHLRASVSLCLLCQNKPMKPPDSLDMHLLRHVERVKYQTCCPICESSLCTFGDALQHLRIEHLLPPTDGQSGPNTSVQNEKVKFPLDKGSGLAVDDSKFPTDPSVSASGAINSSVDTAKLKIGERCCEKCGFKTADKNEFKKHILPHKERPSYFQCQECGYSFVTEKTLKMHLRAVHKITEVDQYVAAEGTNHTPESETVQEIVKNNDLECSVCFEVFDSDALLKTHMRSHGMAFIQAKRNLSN